MAAERFPAVMLRGSVHVGQPQHQDAIDAALAGMTRHQIWRVYDRVSEGREDIVFGYAREDGTEFEACENYQEARKRMYGFDP